MVKRFVVHPGHVVSKNDGQLHYVGAVQLMRLYAVNPRECIVIEPTPGQRRYAAEEGVKLVHLRPRYDGTYSTKIAREEQT